MPRSRKADEAIPEIASALRELVTLFGRQFLSSAGGGAGAFGGVSIGSQAGAAIGSALGGLAGPTGATVGGAVGGPVGAAVGLAAGALASAEAQGISAGLSASVTGTGRFDPVRGLVGAGVTARSLAAEIPFAGGIAGLDREAAQVDALRQSVSPFIEAARYGQISVDAQGQLDPDTQAAVLSRARFFFEGEKRAFDVGRSARQLAENRYIPEIIGETTQDQAGALQRISESVSRIAERLRDRPIGGR